MPSVEPGARRGGRTSLGMGESFQYRPAPMWAHKLTAPARLEPVEVDPPDPDALRPGEVLARFLAGAICGSDLPGFLGRPNPVLPDAHGRPGLPPARARRRGGGHPRRRRSRGRARGGLGRAHAGSRRALRVPRGLGARARRRPAVDPGDGGPAAQHGPLLARPCRLRRGAAGRRDRPGAPRPAVQPRPQGPRRLPRDGRGRDRPPRRGRGLRRRRGGLGAERELGRHPRPTTGPTW